MVAPGWSGVYIVWLGGQLSDPPDKVCIPYCLVGHLTGQVSAAGCSVAWLGDQSSALL